MEPGERVLDRWELVERVSDRGGVERWRAREVDSGVLSEVLVGPRSDARARAAFVDLHGALSKVRDPALHHTLAVRPQDRPVAVRAPVEVQGLDALPRPLDSATVAWIGARLLPAVLAAGPATRGALRASDVALDERGHPVLAPVIEPVNRVALSATRSVAPEAFGGRAPDGAAGLYGLGVLLYELATGKPPATIGTRTDRPPPPPPSSLRHGIPEALDGAILRLLSGDPGKRAGAGPLLQELAGPPVDLRAALRENRPPPSRSPATVAVKTTRSAETERAAKGAGAPMRSPDPDPGGLVVIGPRDLAGLDPPARSHAAGIAGVPLQEVESLIAKGLPLVVATTAGRSAAAARAREIAAATGLPVAASTPPAVPRAVLVAAAALFAAVPGAASLLLLLIGWLPAAISGGVLTAITFAVGLSVALAQGRRQADHDAGTRSYAAAQGDLAGHRQKGPLGAAYAKLSQIRLELARAELPAIPSADLRSALKDIEARLAALTQLDQTADRTLRQVDVSALRTRLSTLNAQASADDARRAERDRLARTVADLEAVEESRAAIAPTAQRLGDVLSEIGAVLVQFEADQDAALAQIDGVARRARTATTPDPAAAATTAAAASSDPAAPDPAAPDPAAPDPDRADPIELDRSEAGPTDPDRPGSDPIDRARPDPTDLDRAEPDPSVPDPVDDDPADPARPEPDRPEQDRADHANNADPAKAHALRTRAKATRQ